MFFEPNQPNHVTWAVSTNHDALAKAGQLHQHASAYDSGRRPKIMLGCVLVLVLVIVLALVCVKPFGCRQATVAAQSARKSDTSTVVPCIRAESDQHLREIINDHPRVVVLYMADFCGHCRAMKPTFLEADKLTPSTQLVLADCEKAISAEMMRAEDITAFPVVKRYQTDQKPTVHGGSRTLQSLVDFMT